MSFTSNFWNYRIYSSERQRRQNGASETRWCGPFYFESPVSNLAVKKWIRAHLGLRDTSHIEVKISLSEKRNAACLEAHRKMLNRELQREISGKPGKARAGNLIVEWLKADVK